MDIQCPHCHLELEIEPSELSQVKICPRCHEVIGRDKEVNFYTPKIIKAVMWVLAVIVPALTIAYPFPYGFRFGLECLWITIPLAILHAILIRIAYELIIVFFEQLKVQRMIKTILIDVAKNQTKTISAFTEASQKVNDTLLEVKKLLERQVTSASNASSPDANANSPIPEQIDAACAFCGRHIVLPGNVVPGQHIRCPYCGEKIVFES